MTAKEISFAENYLCTFNAAEAAKAAGYSERSARQIGYENLTKPYIQDYIRERNQANLDRFGITQERVLSEIAAIAFTDIREFMNDDWTLKPLNEISPRCRNAVSISVTESKRSGARKTTLSKSLNRKVWALEVLWELVKDR